MGPITKGVSSQMCILFIVNSGRRGHVDWMWAIRMPAFYDDHSAAEFGYFFSVNIVLMALSTYIPYEQLPVSETNLSLPVHGKGRSVFG